METKKDVEPDGGVGITTKPSQPPPPTQAETDDFGLPIRRYTSPPKEAPFEKPSKKGDGGVGSDKVDAAEGPRTPDQSRKGSKVSDHGSDDLKQDDRSGDTEKALDSTGSQPARDTGLVETTQDTPSHEPITPKPAGTAEGDAAGSTPKITSEPQTPVPDQAARDGAEASAQPAPRSQGHKAQLSLASVHSNPNETGLSEFSHQKLSTKPEESGQNDDDKDWQEMPAYARYDMYDDDDRLIAREHNDEDDDTYKYGGLGGAGRGYTRVQMDEDAQSATSMDDNTKYLFKESKGTAMVDEDEDDTRDAVSQMQATKDLLTEGQRIAYVGLVRLEVSALVKESEELEALKKVKKEVKTAAEAMRMWGQKVMIRLYAHMDISSAEQVMIEQLADHGVVSGDLTPALYANARVKNPMADELRDIVEEDEASSLPAYPDDEKSVSSRRSTDEKRTSESSPTVPTPPSPANETDVKMPEKEVDDESPAEPPPPYEHNMTDKVPDAQMPSQLPTTEKIDIDLRWTVLCDLFLILILDSVYDARSRVLLERSAKSLDIPWVDICRFEKRVTDALEMQQAAEKENWNEDEHMESRRKRALKRRYMMMGLATVGGGLVIGLSAGLLAPVIGAGLAAGFTTIGVAGTGTFLGGVGGAAIITSGAVASGGIIGVRAADRRTGAVRTFEYRPLHNNKRVNLVVTVAGWLTGKMDDVRLPFSTVDPVMGDLYSVLWEPEMLQSMGDTMRILATEVSIFHTSRMRCSGKLTYVPL